MPQDVHVLIRREPTAVPQGSPTAYEVVLEVHGEADLASAEQLRGELAWALSVAGPRLVLDLSGLTFCDLPGLDVLLAVERGALAQQRSVRWTGESRLVALLHTMFPTSRDRSAPIELPAHAAARVVDLSRAER